MRRLKLGTTGLAVALLLMVPRTASAGMGEVLDIIIGLTGPQMVGTTFDCERNVRTNDMACFVAGQRLPRRDQQFNAEYLKTRKLWASFGGGAYISTGKNSDMREFEAGRVWMLALEPTLNYRSVDRTSNNFALEHGVGPSVLILDGKGFDPFVKGGIKVRPVALTWRSTSGRYIGLAYNLRFFPKGFTAEEFGAAPGTTSHSGREVAHGVTAIFSY